MTETEKKALALVNEVRDERGFRLNVEMQREDMAQEALCRAIEQHEAFRQEVSDAVKKTANAVYSDSSLIVRSQMKRFILPKPVDPLVDALGELADRNMEAEQAAETLRAALAARGGRIVWEGE